MGSLQVRMHAVLCACETRHSLRNASRFAGNRTSVNSIGGPLGGHQRGCLSTNHAGSNIAVRQAYVFTCEGVRYAGGQPVQEASRWEGRVRQVEPPGERISSACERISSGFGIQLPAPFIAVTKASCGLSWPLIRKENPKGGQLGMDHLSICPGPVVAPSKRNTYFNASGSGRRHYRPAFLCASLWNCRLAPLPL